MRLLKTTLIVSAILAAQQSYSAVPIDTESYRDAVSPAGILDHMLELQSIADANGGTREASSPGYQASLLYVQGLLEGAGYEVWIQEFDYPYFEEQQAAVLEQLSPDPFIYPYFGLDGFATMTYSGSGDVTAIAEAVDLLLPPGSDANSSTSGCEPEDFAGFSPGNIAVIQRGSCSFLIKAQNATAAGATGVIIFNEGQPGRTDNFLGTLQEPSIAIPVVGAAFDIGVELAAGGVESRIFVDAISENRTTANLLADTPAGRDDRLVVAGAHLDSVSEGPGINDNGSGSGMVLELALQLAAMGEPVNKVRFAWWGAEEAGLLGAEHYVANLTKREIKNTALNLNFDMVASPNFVRFIYDGDGSATGISGPNGSANIERVFKDYFDSQSLASEPTAFDGRSDYGPFIEVGIPAGGLFTGAEELKTEEQEAIYGGTAGEQLDPCYHLACDTFDNYSFEALDQMSDAAAHTLYTFAMTTSSVNGTDRGSDKSIKKTIELEYQGNMLKR
ncbi:M28 family metallopeptidase [Marinobacterium mangrovicola]|uniref:Zn-dependent M28 family amino/carboxypeptidase n=1 Tax=Marinobacterium mangrovicola TaxID=1476959 RepID=A0A4R1GQV8_9GAMM|nr:M28 family metallopeptidase [Marinobacterium mangrovicola]TCK08529.1 Zn-dependent M28 family amino/carboxypeptidase [Marinobacterium mangrovicola]